MNTLRLIRRLLLGLLFCIPTTSLHAQTPSGLSLEEQRASWLKNVGIPVHRIASLDHMNQAGLQELLIRAPARLGTLRLQPARARNESVRVRLRSEGDSPAYTVVSGGVRYHVWSVSPDSTESFIGTVQIPAMNERKGPFEMEVRMGSGSRPAWLVGLRHHAAPPAERASPRTFAALSSAPSRIPPGSTVESLTTSHLHQGGGRGAEAGARPAPSPSGTANASPTERADPPSSSRPVLNPEHLDTEGIPIQTDDAEIRRLWRIISNATHPAGWEAAHAALAQYFEARGEKQRARLSREKADYWSRLREAGGP